MISLHLIMADWSHPRVGGGMSIPFVCKDQVFVMLFKVLPPHEVKSQCVHGQVL